MILTDYFRSQHDATWDFALQSGVRHGVIRLPEDEAFDLTDKSHWQTVYKRFTDFGITPLVIEPMPNEVHDHIKAGDEMRDECIEKELASYREPVPGAKERVAKVLAIMLTAWASAQLRQATEQMFQELV